MCARVSETRGVDGAGSVRVSLRGSCPALRVLPLIESPVSVAECLELCCSDGGVAHGDGCFGHSCGTHDPGLGSQEEPCFEVSGHQKDEQWTHSGSFKSPVALFSADGEELVRSAASASPQTRLGVRPTFTRCRGAQRGSRCCPGGRPPQFTCGFGTVRAGDCGSTCGPGAERPGARSPRGAGPAADSRPAFALRAPAGVALLSCRCGSGV